MYQSVFAFAEIDHQTHGMISTFLTYIDSKVIFVFVPGEKQEFVSNDKPNLVVHANIKLSYNSLIETNNDETSMLT